MGHEGLGYETISGLKGIIAIFNHSFDYIHEPNKYKETVELIGVRRRHFCLARVFEA